MEIFLRLVYRIGYLIVTELKNLVGTTHLGVKCVVFDQDLNTILLVRHRYKGKDLWYLPGGGMAVGERPDEAMRREMGEEVEIQMSEPVLIGVYKGGKKGRNMTFVFVATSQGEARKALQCEIDDVRLFPLGELPPNLAPGVVDRIGDAAGVPARSVRTDIVWGKW